MRHNNYFQFKQFRVMQEKAAMKVNTDGVLLGAWANVAAAKTVLDIGTGTGIIALMLAQRSSAEITAIEIEKNAADEAAENCKRSKWHERISVRHCSFQQFVETAQTSFDLIVSNPPFFTNGVKNRDQNKSIARHNDRLPFDILIDGTIKLLSQKGRMALILPVDQAFQFSRIVTEKGLFYERLTEVKPNPLKPGNRCLMEFSKNPSDLIKDSLEIYRENGTEYSDQYKKLTCDFYLNF